MKPLFVLLVVALLSFPLCAGEPVLTTVQILPADWEESVDLTGVETKFTERSWTDMDGKKYLADQSALVAVGDVLDVKSDATIDERYFAAIVFVMNAQISADLQKNGKEPLNWKGKKFLVHRFDSKGFYPYLKPEDQAKHLNGWSLSHFHTIGNSITVARSSVESVESKSVEEKGKKKVRVCGICGKEQHNDNTGIGCRGVHVHPANEDKKNAENKPVKEEKADGKK